MYTRILVPLDGLAPAEYPYSKPSMSSSLVDGLEAETQTYSATLTDGEL